MLGAFGSNHVWFVVRKQDVSPEDSFASHRSEACLHGFVEDYFSYFE